MVGKWERIEQEAREEELTELERELHGEQQGGRKPKPRRRQGRQRRRTKPDAPKTNTERDSGTDSTASDG
jgi:hypothetical protein